MGVSVLVTEEVTELVGEADTVLGADGDVDGEAKRDSVPVGEGVDEDVKAPEGDMDCVLVVDGEAVIVGVCDNEDVVDGDGVAVEDTDVVREGVGVFDGVIEGLAPNDTEPVGVSVFEPLIVADPVTVEVADPVPVSVEVPVIEPVPVDVTVIEREMDTEPE